MPESSFSRLYAAYTAEYTEDLPFWLNLAKSSGDPVLELGCGPGRVLCELAQAGLNVTGLDHDEDMIKWARAQIPEKLQEKITFIHGDIRRFDLPDHYPLIIVPCNTFAYFDHDDALQLLMCVKHHLTQNGQLVLSIPNPSQDDIFEAGLSPNGLPESKPISDFIEPMSGNPVQVYAYEEIDREKSTCQVLWAFDELFPDGKVNRLYHPITYHLRSLKEMNELLHHAQLDIKHVFGDYESGPLDQNSHEMIIVAMHPSENGSSWMHE
jgi:SAM-dependent methyltransferase